MLRSNRGDRLLRTLRVRDFAVIETAELELDAPFVVLTGETGAGKSLLVDAAAMNFIRRPESFDVVVGSNLFCDILSDISAIIVGSMGLAASANLDPTRRFPSMQPPSPCRTRRWPDPTSQL